MDRLDRELERAPRQATPAADLWPGIEDRLAPKPHRRLLRAAAALLIFATGVAAGLGIAGRGPTPAGTAGPEPARSPFDTAAEVQREGSEYLAAMARLRTLGGASPAEALARSQGYEAALVVIATASREVAVAADLATPTAGLEEQAGLVRTAASRRVSALWSERAAVSAEEEVR